MLKQFVVLVPLLVLMLIPARAAAAAAEPAVSVGSFTTDLYAHLAAATAPTENLFLSPLSIRAALAMTAAGAQGETESQMLAVLHLKPGKVPDPGFHTAIATINKAPNSQLSIANSLWLQTGYSVQQEFAATLQHDYAAELQTTDFQNAADTARQQINQWVAQHTNDKIQELLARDAIQRNTRMVLANAVYFKAAWEEPFSPNSTQPAPFHLTATEPANVPFMNLYRESLQYFATDQFQAVELPYDDNHMSMVLIIPRTTGGLAEIEKSLTADALTHWLSQLDWQLVRLSLPRFKMTSQFALAQTLAAMGMPDAFDPNKADFSAIATPQQSQREPLLIGQVFHKAYVAVTEEGTEAAASTAVEMRATASAANTPEQIVTADRPFLFLIRHRPTNTILFLGRLADPR